MYRPLPLDCVLEIVDCFEGDRSTLYSCLFVNRDWNRVSVRILWRDIWGIKSSQNMRDLSLKLLRTLIACLSEESRNYLYMYGTNESGNLLHANGISIPTSNRLLYNYVEFCKVLSISEIEMMIKLVLGEQNLDYNEMVAREILKMFMERTFIKKLS